MMKILAVLFAIPLLAAAQGVPYSVVMQFQETAESLAKTPGMVCRLTTVHTSSEDKRPFKVFLESPKGRVEVEVHKDGTFHLPTLPKEDWEETRLVQTLEPGALNISLNFGFGDDSMV